MNTYTYYIAMSTNREARRLPTRHHIIEIKFTGRQFSRERIAHEIERIRERIPNKQFQVLLPYESWKPGSWFEDSEDISLFSLLDHYDESEIPPDGGDPVSYDRFIVYMMDPQHWQVAVILKGITDLMTAYINAYTMLMEYFPNSLEQLRNPIFLRKL